MNIQRHLYLSSAMRSPDEPAAPEPEVIEPVAEVAAEPVAEVQPEAQTEPAATAEPAAQPHGNRGQTPWFMKEIPQLREEKRVEKAAREAAELRAANLQAIIERMQAGADPAGSGAPAKQPVAEADVNSRAVEIANRMKLDDDRTALVQAGQSKYGKEFDDAANIAAAVGCVSDDFVRDVLAVDRANAHEIYMKLAKDPEKAASLVGMDSRRRIAELTRMADAPKTEPKPAAPVAEVKPAAISKAPAPAPRLAPLAAAPVVDPTTPEGNDKMSDAQWEKWYKDKYQKRA